MGNDTRTVQLIVRLLGAIALVGLLGLIGLVALDRAPEAIAVVGTITGGAAGSLGTLLASTRSIDPAQVQKEAEVNLTASLQELAAGGEPDPAPPDPEA